MLRGCRLGRGWMLGGSVSPSHFFPSSIDHSSGEGGSSDVAAKLLGCVRVQLSQGRRKQGIKRSWKDGESGRTVSPRPDLCRAHRGRTHRRTDMEGSAEEDYKEKLLWNVKREVGVVVWRPVVLHIYIFIVLFNKSVHFQITARARTCWFNIFFAIFFPFLAACCTESTLIIQVDQTETE